MKSTKRITKHLVSFQRNPQYSARYGSSNGSGGNICPVIESTLEAEKAWTDLWNKLSAVSLFRKTDSWIFGANVPGKKHAVMFYFKGLSAYRKELREVAADGYRGFMIS